MIVSRAMSDIDALEPTCILAYVDEKGAYDHVRRAALDLAQRTGARLIYYDSASASAFSAPVASGWSAEGEVEKFGKVLTDGQLEALGRHSMALRVREARRAGIDASGWLASHHGMEAFLDYAVEQHADLVLLPDDLTHPRLRDKLHGETVERALKRDRVLAHPIPAAVVDRSGRLERLV